MYFCFVTVLMVICSAQTDFIGFTVDQGDHYGPLYFYSLDETTTTQAPNTPPDFIGFTRTSGRSCDEQNWEVFSDITFQKTTVCHTSKTCTLEQTKDQKGAYGPLYFYSLDETTITQSPTKSTQSPGESTQLPTKSTQSRKYTLS